MALVKRPMSAEAADKAASKSQEQWIGDLRSDDAALRRRAARGLMASEAAPELCRHLSMEPDNSVRSVIFTGLISHPSCAVVEGLISLLRSEDAGLRNGAVEALQKMPDALAPFVDTLLADEDSDLRILLVNVLAELSHPGVPKWLRRVVLLDPHVNVCAAAVDALSEVGGPDDISGLEMLRDRFPDVPFIAFSVDAAIRRIRGR